MSDVADRSSRRRFVAALGASVGSVGLAGCLSSGFGRRNATPDRTVYVGAYHWGFVLLDADGTERERLTFAPGTEIKLVAFSTRAERAIAELPRAVRQSLPDHETLEVRNAERLPAPPDGTMHDALEEADRRYPDHSVAVMPSGYNHARGGMGGGMMLHPMALPHDAPRPSVAGLRATDRGDYSLSCLTYCGYGHPYMDLDGAFVVS
ncbi:MAG: hypothetical protein ABEJ31_06165 [Haloarculaceae archaeon]